MAETSFNPVKQVEAGKKAMSVKWSTNVINLAIKGLDQGQKLVANPFYENNTKLLKGDLVYVRTKEEIAEWLKCSKDIIYFANKYCKLMTPEGIQNIQLRDYQIRYLRHLQKNRLSIYLSCRQSGKCVFFLSRIQCKIERPDCQELKKIDLQNYYIDNGIYEIPIYEIYSCFDKSLRWKIKHFLYKILDRLILWQAKKDLNGAYHRKKAQ